MALASILRADAIRGRKIANNLPSLWRAKENAAAMLEAIGTGLARIER
jgi:hypothetical protein